MPFGLEVFPEKDYESDRASVKGSIKTGEGQHHDQRQIWHRPRYQFDVTIPVRTDDELQTLQNFWWAHNFDEDGEDRFLFEDPKDHSVSGTNLEDGDGSETIFRLKRTVESKSQSYTEFGRFVQSGTDTIYKDGTETSAYSIDLETGVITFDSAPADGVKITADYDFYRRVMFYEGPFEAEPIRIHSDLHFVMGEV